MDFLLSLTFYCFITGRVCIPIDPNNCDDFDPTTVPSLSEVFFIYFIDVLSVWVFILLLISKVAASLILCIFPMAIALNKFRREILSEIEL